VNEITKDHRIRAAGVTQAVIASGAPVKDWDRLIRHGLRTSNYFASVLAGNKPVKPEFKESK
jgi:hypothetical protein